MKTMLDVVGAVKDYVDTHAGGGGGSEKITTKVTRGGKRKDRGFIKTSWNGLDSFRGDYVWTDGENIYFSNNSQQYVLDKLTSTWNTKTWTKVGSTSNIPITPDNIWTDGYNIYISYYTYHGVFNFAESKIESTSWTGLNNFRGSYIWSDGDNIYLSSYTSQYVLDKSTSTWISKTWNGFVPEDTMYLWTDGDNIYYSNGIDQQYVLDKSTSTWNTKTWNENGYRYIYANCIWTDGENIYHANSKTNTYMLDKSTDTWKRISFNGADILPTSISAARMWVLDDNIYYSDNSNQFVFRKITANAMP